AVRECRTLDRLGGVTRPDLLPVRHALQHVVELVDRVLGVGDLLGRAPAHRRPHLEDAQRVAVAVVDVAQAGLGHPRLDGDLPGARAELAFLADRDDLLHGAALLGVQLAGGVGTDLHVAGLRGPDRRVTAGRGDALGRGALAL